MYANLPRMMMMLMLCVCVCLCVALQGFLMNCVTEFFILEAKQQRKSGLDVDWDNQSVSLIVTKLEQKKNAMGLSL